jgi:CO dehydrogenase/acetyl-CoA synthase gamma subunit (corrinoid Fe-S protein)
MWTNFEARLRELGYVEGRNVAIAFINLEGRPERYEEVVKKLAQFNPDIVVASGPEFALKAALAGKRSAQS